MFVQIPKNNSIKKLHKMHFLSMQKNYMQPAQVKLHPDENFLHHAKIKPPYFAGQIKRALQIQKTLLIMHNNKARKVLCDAMYAPPCRCLLFTEKAKGLFVAFVYFGKKPCYSILLLGSSFLYMQISMFNV